MILSAFEASRIAYLESVQKHAQGLVCIDSAVVCCAIIVLDLLKEDNVR